MLHCPFKFAAASVHAEETHDLRFSFGTLNTDPSYSLQTLADLKRLNREGNVPPPTSRSLSYGCKSLIIHSQWSLWP